VQDNTTSELTFTDLRQPADAAAGLCDIIRRHGLGQITGEFVEAAEFRAQLRECVEGAMGSLREFEALLFSEEPLDEPVQLLSADEGYMGEAFPGLRDFEHRLQKPTESRSSPRLRRMLATEGSAGQPL
jgi:hypothetical protein